MTSFIPALSILVLALASGCFTLPITESPFSETSSPFYNDVTTDKPLGERMVFETSSVFDDATREPRTLEDVTEALHTVEDATREPRSFDETTGVSRTFEDVTREPRMLFDMTTDMSSDFVPTTERSSRQHGEVEDSSAMTVEATSERVGLIPRDFEVDSQNETEWTTESSHSKREFDDTVFTTASGMQSSEQQLSTVEPETSSIELQTDMMSSFTSTSSAVAPELYTTRKYTGLLADKEDQEEGKERVDEESEKPRKNVHQKKIQRKYRPELEENKDEDETEKPRKKLQQKKLQRKDEQELEEHKDEDETEKPQPKKSLSKNRQELEEHKDEEEVEKPLPKKPLGKKEQELEEHTEEEPEKPRGKPAHKKPHGKPLPESEEIKDEEPRPKLHRKKSHKKHESEEHDDELVKAKKPKKESEKDSSEEKKVSGKHESEIEEPKKESSEEKKLSGKSRKEEHKPEGDKEIEEGRQPEKHEEEHFEKDTEVVQPKYTLKKRPTTFRRTKIESDDGIEYPKAVYDQDAWKHMVKIPSDFAVLDETSDVVTALNKLDSLYTAESHTEESKLNQGEESSRAE